MTLNTEALDPHMRRLAKYRLALRERDRLIHKGTITGTEAAVINHANSYDFAAELAEGLDVAGQLARDLARRVEALEFVVKGLREMNDVQRRAIAAYQADRARSSVNPEA